MTTYFIGDIHGCLDELKLLLELIDYDPQCDCLGFVGDLVNRGPHSLETLRFVKALPRSIVVLGNHDLGLLALYYEAITKPSHHFLQAVNTAKDCDELMYWLRMQPVLYQDPGAGYVVVHAGIPPQWTIGQAVLHARELEAVLHSDQAPDFFAQMFGAAPTYWSETLTGMDRLRYITNALTRMRFCDAKGCLDIDNKTDQAPSNDIKPWFAWRDTADLILFGHWAAIEGKSTNPSCLALDTGCVWGKKLTAYCIETGKYYSVPSLQ